MLLACMLGSHCWGLHKAHQSLIRSCRILWDRAVNWPLGPSGSSRMTCWMKEFGIRDSPSLTVLTCRAARR